MMSTGSRVSWVSAEAPLPKPVQRDVHAHERSAATSSPTRSSRSARRCVDLDDQPLRREAGAAEGRWTSATRVPVATCRWRGRHRAGSAPRVWSGAVGGHGLVQHPAVQLAGQSGAFGEARNSTGGMSPSSGCRQRSSASTPTTRRSLREMIGSKSRNSSPRSRAPGGRGAAAPAVRQPRPERGVPRGGHPWPPAGGARGEVGSEEHVLDRRPASPDDPDRAGQVDHARRSSPAAR